MADPSVRPSGDQKAIRRRGSTVKRIELASAALAITVACTPAHHRPRLVQYHLTTPVTGVQADPHILSCTLSLSPTGLVRTSVILRNGGANAVAVLPSSATPPSSYRDGDVLVLSRGNATRIPLGSPAFADVALIVPPTARLNLETTYRLDESSGRLRTSLDLVQFDTDQDVVCEVPYWLVEPDGSIDPGTRLARSASVALHASSISDE